MYSWMVYIDQTLNVVTCLWWIKPINKWLVSHIFFYYYLCVGSLSWILLCYRKAPVMIIYCTHASKWSINQSVCLLVTTYLFSSRITSILNNKVHRSISLQHCFLFVRWFWKLRPFPYIKVYWVRAEKTYFMFAMIWRLLSN